jgi:hypothetical protein
MSQKLNDPVVEQFSTDFSAPQKEVLALKTHMIAMSPTVTPSQNQPPPPSTAGSQLYPQLP